MDSVILSLCRKGWDAFGRGWNSSILRAVCVAIGATLRRWYQGSSLVRPLFSDWHESDGWHRSVSSRLASPLLRVWDRLFQAIGRIGRRLGAGSGLLPYLEGDIAAALARPLPIIGQLLFGFGASAWLVRLATGAAPLAATSTALCLACVIAGALLQLLSAPLAGLLGGSWFGRLFMEAFGLELQYDGGDGTAAPAGAPRTLLPLVAGLVGGAATVLTGLLALKGLAALIGGWLVLRRPWFGLVALGLVMPFVSTTIMLGLVGLTFVAWLLNGAVRGELDFRPDPVFVPACFFLIAAALSTAGSLTISGSLQPLMLYIAAFLLYLLAGQLLRQEGRLRAVAAGLLVAGVVAALIGLYQYVIGVKTLMWVDVTQQPDLSTRVFSTFGNPNVLAEYLTLLIPISVALVWAARRWSGRIIQACVALVMLGCLAATYSRGGYLAIALAALIYLAVVAPALLLVGAVAALVAPYFLPASVMGRIQTIGSLQDTSNLYRLAIWTGTLNLLRQLWLPGAGLGAVAFGLAYARYRVSGATAFHSHNIILQILSEMGTIGLLAFLWLLFNLAKHVFIRLRGSSLAARALMAAGLAGVAGHLMHGMVDNVWFNPKVMFLFWIVVGLTMAVKPALAGQNNG